MKKTELNFDFLAHQELCQEKIYKEIQTFSYQEQIQYYHELIANSTLEKFWNSIKTKKK
ncbi:MAG: hypothetical protein HC916_09095 [Coleofasciculaceae cyanobacterium SM2_1_6]|nr:hypothetical protein [Coleofasciculaceae cyanobacterium SM2_1_6]